jgi:hypothetical protein
MTVALKYAELVIMVWFHPGTKLLIHQGPSPVWYG